MKFNLHTHTYRCHHAEGTDEEYVLAAIESGYDMIGFSDHAPYLFPLGHKSGFRMDTADAEGYVNSIRSLQDKYSHKIQIKLGFETEYYPNLIDRELAYLAQFDYDYLILGQHFTFNEYEPWAKYAGAKTDSVATLDRYISQVTAAARSGKFTYICHPDLINFTGDRQLYLQKMHDMLSELKKTDIPLEYNFYGYFDNRQYPAKDFWQMVQQVGNPVVVGLDAHWPGVYADRRIDDMLKEIADLGIKPIEEIKLIGAKRS